MNKYILFYLLLVLPVFGQGLRITELPEKDVEDGDKIIMASGGTNYRADIGATLDTRDTANRARANHTGEQAIGTVTGLQAALDNRETISELDARSALDRARANHTGDQAISTVTGLQTALDNVSVAVNADDTITFSDADGANISFKEGLVERTGADNFMLLHESGYASPNTIDAANTNSLNLGTEKSFIGAQAMPSIGSVDAFGFGTPAEYAVDSGYVGGDVVVVTIGGGYDHVNNAIGSVISGGGHNFIKYDTSGHSAIVGGSWNLIQSGRGFIGGGAMNQIVDTAWTSRYNTIPNGLNNRLDGTRHSYALGSENVMTKSDYANMHAFRATVSDSYYSRIMGLDPTVTNSYHVQIHGDGNSITDSPHADVSGLDNTATESDYATVQGSSVSVTGSSDYSNVHGANITVASARHADVQGDAHNLPSGNYQTVRGTGHSASHLHAVITGANGKTMSAYSSTLSTAQLNEQGDAQTSRHVMAARTADAAITNLAPQMSGMGSVVSGFGEIYLIGTRDGTANADADYSQAAYKLEFGFFWDGTNGYFFKTGAETALAAAPTMDLEEVSHTTNSFTAGALPRLAISTGSLRTQVTGIAATTINWVGRMDLVYTRISQ